MNKTSSILQRSLNFDTLFVDVTNTFYLRGKYSKAQKPIGKSGLSELSLAEEKKLFKHPIRLAYSQLPPYVKFTASGGVGIDISIMSAISRRLGIDVKYLFEPSISKAPLMVLDFMKFHLGLGLFCSRLKKGKLI